MANKTYCATGNMEIGMKVKNILVEIGRVLALNGYTLRSGGAPGAESAFEEGCDSVGGKKEIYLPFEGYNNKTTGVVTDMTNEEEAIKIAQRYYLLWFKLSNKVKQMLTRYSWAVLGRNLDDPVDFVIAYIREDGKTTEQVVRVANGSNITVYNIGSIYRYSKEQAAEFIKEFAAKNGLKLEENHDVNSVNNGQG